MFKPHATPQRKAFTIAEFAAMFGKHRSWAYRQVRSGKIKTIVGFGNELVPASEIGRIVGEFETTEAGS